MRDGTSGLREQLMEVYERRGELTPTIVVEEASDPASPLHARLEWDDAKAAHAHRLDQAHRLIQSVRIRYRDGEREVDIRAFQCVRTGAGIRYTPSEEVASDPFLSRLVMSDMEREWRALKRRYDEFEEFWSLVRGDTPPGPVAA